MQRATIAVTLLLSMVPLGSRLPAAAAREGPAPPAGQDVRVAELRDEMRRLIGSARDSVFPALVHIEAVTVRYQDGMEMKGRSGGSGAIISPQGYVITNEHVIENGRSFRCTLADKRQTTARLIGSDPLTDLAILQLDVAKLAPGGAAVPFAELGSSADLEVGDYVLAMGSPFTLARSVSLGIVSNTERVFGPGVGGSDLGGIELDLGQHTGIFTRWIQHDAALNPGNSGGPLVSMTGKIVGVNELGGDQIGFAIPSTLVRKVAAELIAHGFVRRGWLGLNFKPLSGTGIDSGALIGSIANGGPAARGGLRVGDVILSLGGQATTVRYLEEVPLILERISELPIGAPVDVTYARGGAIGHARLVSEELPSERGEQRALDAWGFVAEDVTAATAADLLLGSARGVLVTGTRAGGPAALAEPPLAAGDVVETIDGQAVVDLAALVREYELLRGGETHREQVLVSFDRRGQSYLSILRQRPFGRPQRPPEVPKAWLGIATQPVTRELAHLMGDAQVAGYRVARVFPGTAAAAAGLLPGDVIERLNGQILAPRGERDADSLAETIGGLPIGEAVTLGVVRDGASHDVEVALEARRITPLAATRVQSLACEMTVREITFFDRDENRWPAEVEGVLIEEAEAAGSARLAGLRQNDLVQQLGPYVVRDLESYRKAIEGLSREQAERLAVVVRRGSKTLLDYLEPNWKRLPVDRPGDLTHD